MGEHWHLSLSQPLRASLPFPARLISVSSFKVQRNIQDPCSDMAYLLVCLGNTMEDRQYGVSLVLVNPNQTRATTMEEAVEKLATCPPSGPN